MRFGDYIKIARLDDVIQCRGSTWLVDSLDLCRGVSTMRIVDIKTKSWTNGIVLRSNGKNDCEDSEEVKIISNYKTMKITNLVKKILDNDTRTLVKAGFINGDLALTDEGVGELLGILFLEKKAELLKVAQEKLDEIK